MLAGSGGSVGGGSGGGSSAEQECSLVNFYTYRVNTDFAAADESSILPVVKHDVVLALEPSLVPGVWVLAQEARPPYRIGYVPSDYLDKTNRKPIRLKGFHTPNQRGGGKKHSAALSVRRLFTSSASSSTTSAAVQRASAAHTSFDTVQWADALALFRARKYHLAIASFLTMREGLTSAKAFYNVGSCYHQLGKLTTALFYYTQALAHDRYLVVAYFARGACYYQARDFFQASLEYSSALMAMGYSKFIDYHSMGLKFILSREQLLFNRALSFAALKLYRFACDDLAQALKVSNCAATKIQANKLLRELLPLKNDDALIQGKFATVRRKHSSSTSSFLSSSSGAAGDRSSVTLSEDMDESPSVSRSNSVTDESSLSGGEPLSRTASFGVSDCEVPSSSGAEDSDTLSESEVPPSSSSPSSSSSSPPVPSLDEAEQAFLESFGVNSWEAGLDARKTKELRRATSGFLRERASIALPRSLPPGAGENAVRQQQQFQNQDRERSRAFVSAPIVPPKPVVAPKPVLPPKPVVAPKPLVPPKPKAAASTASPSPSATSAPAAPETALAFSIEQAMQPSPTPPPRKPRRNIVKMAYRMSSRANHLAALQQQMMEERAAGKLDAEAFAAAQATLLSAEAEAEAEAVAESTLEWDGDEDELEFDLVIEEEMVEELTCE